MNQRQAPLRSNCNLWSLSGDASPGGVFYSFLSPFGGVLSVPEIGRVGKLGKLLKKIQCLRDLNLHYTQLSD